MSVKMIVGVCFIVTMFLWMLILLGAITLSGSGWLAFFACLLLGIAVFVGTG